MLNISFRLQEIGNGIRNKIHVTYLNRKGKSNDINGIGKLV